MLKPEEAWTTGLFGCCSDIGTCCFGSWCLPCLYGKNASKLRSTTCEANTVYLQNLVQTAVSTSAVHLAQSAKRHERSSIVV
ncbi:hypothetical protein WJX82_010336 [Trebouxia sp. C0006]